MERIQTALDKARAERAATQGVPAPAAPAAPPRPVATGSPTATPVMAPAAPATPDAAPVGRPPVAPPVAPAAPGAVEAAWAALREVRVDPRQLERAHVVAAVGGPESAAFDVMRTKLLHQARAQGWRRVAVSSPGPACGKTTVALNLAFGLARQADLRVMLVEADLRRPAIGRILGIRDPEGSAEVLGGAADPAGALRRHRANLAALVASGPRRNPAELLQSPRAGEALDRIEALYEPTLTLFDMPPMMAGDDVMAFAGLMDGVLLVAAAGATTIAQIDACERELATRTNVVGVVLNKCRYLDRDQDYAGAY